MPSRDPVQQLVAEKLEQLAAQRGRPISGREAAKLCHIAPSTWSRHMRPYAGRHELGHDLQVHISKGLGIPLDQLEQAAIEAAHYVIDIRDFSAASILSAWSRKAGIAEQERDAFMRHLGDLAALHLEK